MKELALHILDVVENGITAGGDCIRIRVNEARKENRLEIDIEDNGRGISSDILEKVTDPFITSRTTRRVGLGLSLFEAAARRCDGHFVVKSQAGKGTTVNAVFQYDHIDRAPIGDIAGTLMILIVGNPKVDFVYHHLIDGDEFSLDTREIKRELEDLPISDPTVIRHLTRSVRNAIEELAQENQE